MSQLISTTRYMLIVLAAAGLIAGCDPVGDTTSTPLPVQNNDEAPADDSSVDVRGDMGTDPGRTLPDENNTNPDEGVTDEPVDTEPAAEDASDNVPDETNDPGASEIDSSTSETESETETVTETKASSPDESVDAEGVTSLDTESSADPVVATNPGSPIDAAESETLTIGDLAPPLLIDTWVKGDAVEQFNEGHVYVVEFWATNCGPCLTSMPHISQLQEDHRETVTFIGITREDEETVRAFMNAVPDEDSGKTWNDVIQHTIALDLDNATNNAYMAAADQTRIPTAFIVGKDGVIEWMGHPMSIDDPIAQVLSDAWDREAALAKFEADREVEQAQQEVSIAAHRAKQTGDWTEVLQMVEKMVLKHPESPGMRIMQFNALMVAEEYDELKRVAEQLRVQVWDDADYLNRLAWQMVTRVPKEHQDLDLALKIARCFNEMAEGNPSVMDTVARVYYEMGDRENAIQWQKQAIQAAPEEQVLQDTLKTYEAE